MKKWFKRVVIALALLAMVAVVGVAIFLLTFDPNAYKYKLADMVQSRYDRTLAIDGDIELSLFPRIGLNVQGVSLSEPGRPQDTFASVDSARVAVAVWPLLFNRLVVDHVAINGFKARVVRGKDGEFNFRNLVGAAPVLPAGAGAGAGTDPARAAAGAAAVGLQAGAGAIFDAGEAARRADMQIDIAGLDLQDGEIFLQDEITGMAVRVSRLNANTGRVTFDQPFDVSVSARMEGGNPRVDAGISAQGLVKLDPAAMRYTAQRLDLRAEGRFPGLQAKALTARGNLAFDGTSRSLDASALEILFQGDVLADTPLTGVEATMTMPKLAAHPGRQRLQIERLAVRAKGAMADEGPFELALDAPALQVSPDEAGGEALTGRLRMAGAEPLDAGFALTGISGSAHALDIKEARLEAALKQGERLVKVAATSPLSLSMTERTAAFSALKGDVNIADPTLPKGDLQIPVIGSLSADLIKDQASAKINAVLEGGQFDLTASATRLAQPRVNFSLTVDTLDLDKLAPPTPVPLPKPPAGKPGSGQDEGEAKAQPPAPPPAQPAAETSLDFSALAGITANGTLKVGKLVVRGLRASDVSAQIRVDAGRLDVSTLTASLYDGKLAGVLFLDSAKGNQVGAKMSLAGVSIEPLLTDVAKRSSLSGRGSLALDLKTAGGSTLAWRRALGGSVQLRLRDGAIKGINVAQTLRELKDAFRAGRGEATDATAGASAGRQTDFTELEADVSFAKGIGTVRRLNLAAPVLRVSQGDPASLDLVAGTLDLVVKVKVVNTSTGQDGKGLEELQDLTIPVHVTGPFEQPEYQVQWAGVGSEALRRTLEKRLLDAVSGKRSGSGSSKEAPKDAIRDVGKALKGLLGK